MRKNWSRVWCFTSWDKNKKPKFYKCMKYICFAPEITPTTHKFHWQGYVYFKDIKSIKATVRSLRLGKEIKVLKSEGSGRQNKVYIKGPYTDKNNKTKPLNKDFEEYGVVPSQGKRTDLIILKDKLMNRECCVDDIVCEDPIKYHQYGRTLNKIEDIALRKKWRTKMTKGLWYVGATGVGKSEIVFKDYDPSTHYVYPYDKGWWDGYTGQGIVIINEFRGQIKYGELLELCDWTPKTVKRRNREPIPFLAHTILITSCSYPSKIYYNLSSEDSIDQLLRRFKIIDIE